MAFWGEGRGEWARYFWAQVFFASCWCFGEYFAAVRVHLVGGLALAGMMLRRKREKSEKRLLEVIGRGGFDDRLDLNVSNTILDCGFPRSRRDRPESRRVTRLGDRR